MILDTTRSRRAVTRRALLLALTPVAVALVALAMLWPTAQATPAAASAAPLAKVNAANGTSARLWPRGSHSPLDLHAAHFAMLTGRPGEQPTLIVGADLTINGIKLLAGVTDPDKPQGVWWSGAGFPLSTPVSSAYRPIDISSQYPLQPWSSRPAAKHAKRIAFAFRLPATLQGAVVRYGLPQSRNFTADGAWPDHIDGRDQLTEAQLNSYHNGARILLGEYPISAVTANVRLGIAVGSWTKIASQPPTRSARTRIAGSSGTLIFSLVMPERGKGWGVTITRSEPKQQDIRIVAVDAHGHELLPTTSGGAVYGSSEQLTSHFTLPLAQIKEIRVETRPFQWIELKDVALQPAQ